MILSHSHSHSLSRTLRILGASVCASVVALSPLAKAAPVPEDAVSPHFETVAKHLDLGGTMFAYMDIDGDMESLASTISELFKAQGAPPELARLDLVEILRTLGISQISAVGLSSYQRDDRFHNKAFLHIPGGRAGFLKAFGGDPGPLLSKSIAPADTDLILEQDLDLKIVVETIRNVLRSVGAGEAVGEMDRALEEKVMGPVTAGELLLGSPNKVTVIGRIDREKRIRIPDGPDVAEFDLLIALDGMNWLFRKFKSLIPPEALAKVHIDGDGFEALISPEPAPAPFESYLPIVYVADGDKRLYIATRKSFLDACLASDGEITESEDFKLASAGLPAEGNALTYISPDVTAEFRHIIKSSNQKMGPTELMVIESIGGEMTADLEYGVAHVSTNLPDGILWASNTVTSHKSTAMSLSLTPIAVMASFAVPTFNKVVSKAQETKNINSAKQFLLATMIHAADHRGEFPDSLDEIGDDYLDLEMRDRLQWHNTETEEYEEWLYLGKGLNNSCPASLMMLASPKSVNGSRIVGYVDGSVESVPDHIFQDLKAERREWKRKKRP